MSQKLGLSTDTFQKLDYVLSQNGASIDSFGVGMKTLQNVMDEAVQGINPAEKAFDNLGLSIYELGQGAYSPDELRKKFDNLYSQAAADGMSDAATALNTLGISFVDLQMTKPDKLFDTFVGSLQKASTETNLAQDKLLRLGLSLDEISKSTPEQAMELAIGALQEMAPSAEKTALALDVFGKQGMELMPILNMTAEEFQKSKQAAEDLGMVMSEDMIKAGDDFGDMLDNVKGMMAGLGNQIGSQLLPSMTQGLDAFIGFVQGTEGAEEKLQGAMDGMVSAITEIIPQFVEKGAGILLALVEGIVTALPSLVEGVMEVIPTIATTILSMIPKIAEAGIEVLAALISGIASALPDIIPAAIQTVMDFITAVLDKLPLIVESGWALLQGLVDGIIAAIPVLLENLPTVIEILIDFFIESIPIVIDAGIQLLTSIVTALPEIIRGVVAAIPKIINAIVGKLDTLVPLLIDAGVKLLVALVENLPAIIAAIIEAVPLIIDGIVGAFDNLIGEIIEIGGNLLKGIWEGIKDAGAWLWDKISGFFGGIVDKIKGFFGIKSPSKLFEKEIGSMLPAGMAVGIEKGIPLVVSAVNSMADAAQKVFDGISFEPNTDYMAKINEAIAVGDLEAAKALEIKRNAKIQAMGIGDYSTTDMFGGIGTGIGVAVTPVTQSQESIADMISQALYSGLTLIADTIFNSLPRKVDMNVNGQRIAEATWDDSQNVGNRRGQMFAPTEAQIRNIAMNVARGFAATT